MKPRHKFAKGYTPWNKGKKLPPSFGKKISDAQTGMKRSIEVRTKLSEERRGAKNPMFGKTLSTEHRKKISEAHKKIGAPWMKGRKLTTEHIKNRTLSQSGEKSVHWKGGCSTGYLGKHAPYPRPDQCEICGTLAKDLKKRLSYDHDHQTGKFRGWICLMCNSALGMARDNIEILEEMIKYLIKSRQ